MSRPIRVAILGASGYGAGELLRLLTQHPAAEVVSVTSTSQVGEPIGRVHPHLRGFYGDAVAATVDFDRLLGGEYGIVFSALPSGASGTAVDAALAECERRGAVERVRAIDLSGDLRLRDAGLHAQHYSESPLLPERRAAAVYGLTELERDAIRTARLIANPGCLATAAVLAAAPLVQMGVGGTLAIDAKTGSSGSGRTLKETTHHPTRHADFRAYKPLAHQHEPEIMQALGDAAGQRLTLSFVAQSMDAARGIFCSVHATLPREMSAAALRAEYERFYAECPFVRMVDESPALQNVVGSNLCDIAVACRGQQVIAMAAIDNLVKGMAGAAIQNMNVMCGLAETTGLWSPSFRPV